MYGLIKDNLLFYIIAAIFAALCLGSMVYGATKKVENKKLKIIIRVSVSCILLCLWLWCFVWANIYPLSLAVYEYNNSLTDEVTGVIEKVEQDTKDRMYFVVNNTKYTMVYSSTVSFDDFAEGDVVKIKFGEGSRYIFDIRRKTDDSSAP